MNKEKPTKQQRINELAWNIIDYFFPEDFEDLEQGLIAVSDRLDGNMKSYNELKEDLLKDDAIRQEYEGGCRTTLDK